MIREPIARQVSAFFENCERDARVAGHDVDWSLEALCDTFLRGERFWQPPSWFDYEMKQVWEIDVYDYPFPRERGYLVITRGKLELLILKLEVDDAIKERVIAQFLGIRNFRLVRANEARHKDYAKTYRAFVQTIRLPAAYIEAMYNARFSRHFYSRAEIEHIRSRWQGRIPISEDRLADQAR
ncbi:MAG: putative capsular polysaccharide synthesis family protein [Planctomycetota bacterium]